MAKNKKTPVKGELEIRSFNIADLTSNDDEKYIEGHPAVYDQRTNIADMFYEIIERGAFDGCDFDDVLFSANHGWREKIPLARSRRNNGNSTMQISTDTQGLYIKAYLDIEGNTEARNLYSAVRRGDIDGMSLAFHVQEERWENLDKPMPTRRVIKVKKVREVSAVNFPQYAGTDINARGQVALDNAARVLENARLELDNSKNEQLERMRLKTLILMKG